MATRSSLRVVGSHDSRPSPLEAHAANGSLQGAAEVSPSTHSPPSVHSIRHHPQATSIGSTPQQRQVALNAAFMWEIKSVNEDLWLMIDHLHAYCRRPHRIARSRGRFVDLLEQFLDGVAMQFSLEEAYGYFEDPMYVEPAICQRALDFQAEHRQLYRLLMELVDEAQEALYEADEVTLVYRLPARVEAFVEQLLAHDRRECELTLTAMNEELGVGD